MCALTAAEQIGINGKWEFIKYAQSSHVEVVQDSSVSYVSAYWVQTE
jgi:predicted class III extradiol MEMO1 family dioxygenase